jgi:phage tail sheath protein FI
LVTSGSAPLTSPTAPGSQLLTALALKNVTTPPVQFRKNVTIGSGAKQSAEPQYYWGMQFEHVESLTTPNASTLANNSMKSFAKFFPSFSTTNQNFVVGDNEGAADTAANGVVDADKFCLNLFSLENIQVVTASTRLADPSQWKSATYVRNGNITADDTAKTRSFKKEDLIQANRRFAKFSFIMQGGFDGVNIFDADEAKLSNAAVTADIEDVNRGENNGPNVKAYTKAIDIMKNVVNADIQVLAIPGIRHPFVTNTAIDAVEERFDALYLMDIEQYDNDNALVTADSQIPSVEYTVQAFRDRSLNSSFGATYFPDVVMSDPNTKTNLIVPSSVAVLGALSLNDAVAHPWFAPAGTTRGALASVQEARTKLSKNDMDNLYDVAINPLVAFPGNASVGTNPKGGVVVWGQKTLQSSASALDRVNVRRLLIDIRRQVREIANFIVFEPSREATLAAFTAAVTPRLQRIQALQGLEKFKVIIDSSTTTQQDVLNNTLRGKIYVQPKKSIEYVGIDFVTSNNATEIK